MPMRIKPDECINCAACEADCPTESITEADGTYVVDEATCTECKDKFETPHCVEVCPVEGCIVQVAA